MSQLSLSLMGSFRATLEGVPLTAFESNKVRALLAYLTVEADQPHSRDLLAGLFWPFRPNSNALSNLRYALYNLRTAIGDRTADPPFLLISHHAVQFNTASDHRLDVAAFEGLTSGLALSRDVYDKKPGTIDDEQCRRLASAVALYSGPFLDGFSLSGSPGFEEWALLKREQIDREMGSALRQLVAAHREQRDYQSAIRCARQQLELEPWDERTHRDLMRLLALTRGRGAALRQYEACCRLLERDLGVQPTAGTRRLYERLRQGRPGADVPRIQAPWPSVIPSRPPSPVVGRTSELSKLEGLLDAALSGQGCVAFIVGEAGSGKTTLMHAFTHRALEAHPDLVTASGSCCHHAGTGDAYLPFREILQSLTGDVEPRRAAGSLTREEADRLWRLFPHVIQCMVNQAPSLIDRFVPGEALWERAEAFWPRRAAWKTHLHTLVQRSTANKSSEVSQPGDLFEQVTNLLRAIAAHQPLILTIDDLQFADPASISMLFHVGRHLGGSRVLILGAHRPVPSSRGVREEQHPLLTVLNEFQRLFGDIQVNLDGSDGRAFIEALLDTEPNCLDDAFRERLEQHTGGNALFTVELLRGLQRRGDLRHDANGRWIVGPSLDWEQLPPRAEAVIAERLAQLPPQAREVLGVASVEGQTFTAQVVAQALGSPLPVVQDLLDGLLGKEHQLVQPLSLARIRPQHPCSPLTAGTLSRYRFRHGLFQTYLYDSLNDIQRARLHESVAYALEAYRQQGGIGTATGAARVAWHFEAGGLIEKATEYLLLAGTEAMDLSANEEAIRCFAHALDLLERLPPSPERAERELELQVALGAPLLAAKGWGAAERGRASKRAYDLSKRSGVPRHHLMNAMFSLADLSRAQGDYQTSLELGEQMLHLANQGEDERYLALAHSTLGETHFFRASFNEAHHHLKEALTSFDPREHRHLTLVTGPNLGVMCLVWESWTAWFLGWLDQALCRAHEAVSLGREIDHPFSLAFALALGGAGLPFLRREYDLARAPIKELGQIVSQHDLPAMGVWASILGGWSTTFEDDAEGGLTKIRQGMATWREMGAATGSSFQTLLLVEACRRIGRTGEALLALDRGLDLINSIQERCFRAEMHRLRGELLLERGDPSGEATKEAAQWLQSALDIARKQGSSVSELRAAIGLARLWKRDDGLSQPRRFLEEAYVKFSEGFDAPDLRDAQTLLEDLPDG